MGTDNADAIIGVHRIHGAILMSVIVLIVTSYLLMSVINKDMDYIG
jgi:hypothetical protein